jgi:TonB-dependent receptor
MKSRITSCLLLLATIVTTLPSLPAADASAPAAGGVITGAVSNLATRNLLEGARVAIPRLDRVALTDATGSFLLEDLPPGAHEVVVTYTGLDPEKATIAVTPGGATRRNFDLTAGIYVLETFTVTGEREGNAAAITAQRNADNLKNIVALDAYGNLPNMNASELAVQLPGIAGNLSDEGNITGFTVRGMTTGSNTITIDGALMGSQGGGARQTRIHTMTGSMFDALEVTKGHTPDKEAGSLGGTINLKSRSPLAMKEKRRVTYNFSARMAPPGSEQIPLREQHRTHPLLNVAWQEVFGILGGERNLGLALNLFYSEQAVGFFSTTRDFQNTVATPAYVWDFRAQDNYNNRKQSSVNLKFDYRLSANTRLSLNYIFNDAFERFRLRHYFRAFTGNQNAVPSATTGVIPGFTNRITEVRPVAASTVSLQSQMSNFFHRQRHFDLGAEQRFGPLELDYNAVVSLDSINSGSGDGGDLTVQATGVGWILDRTQSDLYPRFTQTGGPDLRNPASYRPTTYLFNDNKPVHEIRELRGNARYQLPFAAPTYLKTGFRLREEVAGTRINKDRRYTFLGTNAAQLPVDPTVQLFGDHKLGLQVPRWTANALARGRTPLDTALWTEDRYFAEQSKYTGARLATETVNAVYGMGQTRLGRTGIMAGVRMENTEDASWGWVRSRVGSTAAQQAADPIGSARRDYADNRRELSGSYTKFFPSVHLTHDLAPNLKARLSWSNSFGRPPLNNLMPSETINETAQTLEISNPSLKPRAAESWDATLEYYFEPVGNLAAGWFHKTISDYWVGGILSGTVASGPDNGYNGEYAGFSILTTRNLGTAYVQGWELSYNQQMTFLPGLLRGLGAGANFTFINTHGNFGGTVERRTGEVVGFIPFTANANLYWRHRGFSARAGLNRTGEYINAFTASGSGRNQYIRSRTIVNAGIAYQYRPWLGFSIDVNNLFNEPQVWYRGVADNISEYRIPGTTVTFGVSGRF